MSSLKKIIFTKDSLFKHLTIFAISGIMAICLLYVLCAFFYDLPLMNYFFIKASAIDGIIGFVVLLILFTFIIGYIYKLSNLNLNGNFEFEDISLDCFKYTPKILLISSIWVLYSYILKAISMHNIVIEVLDSFIQIFVGILLVIFSKDFKIKKMYFNPITIIHIINKMILPTLKFVLLFFIIFIAMMILTTGVIILTNSLNFVTGNTIKILWACLLFYLLNISNIVFVLYIGNTYSKNEFLHIQKFDNL